MINGKNKQLSLSSQSVSIRTMDLHIGSVSFEEMIFYTNTRNLIDLAPKIFVKLLIAPIYFLLRLIISHIALKNNKNEK